MKGVIICLKRNPLLWLLGGVFAVWFFEIIILNRPFFIAATDVEMDFLFRGLAVARGQFFDHTFGVPVDLLGAAVISLFTITIENIELFFPIAYLLGLIGLILSTIFLYKKFLGTHIRALSLAAFLIFFLNPSARLYMSYWSAEMFVFLMGVLSLALFWDSIIGARVAPSNGQSPIGASPSRSLCSLGTRPIRSIFFTGLAVGASVGLKTYFIVLVAACAIGYLQKWLIGDSTQKTLGSFIRLFAAYLAGIGMGLFVSLLPFINSPGSIVYSLLNRAETGSALELLKFNFSVLVGSDPVWFFVFCLLFIVLAISQIYLIRKMSWKTPDSVFATALIACMGLGFMAALVQPNAGTLGQPAGVAIRFFLPVAVYSVFAFGLIARIYEKSMSRVAPTLASLILILLGIGLYQDFQLNRHLRTAAREAEKIVVEFAGVHRTRTGKEPKILFGDILRPSVALHTGDQYSRGLFAEDIGKRFANEGYKNLSYPLTVQEIVGYEAVFITSNSLRSIDEKILRESGFASSFEERDDFILFNKLQE